MQPAIYTDKDFRRLLSKLEEHEWNGCIEWQGGTSDKGYGRIKIKGRDYYTHRVMYEFSTGEKLTTEDLVMHECDNPRCCRPSHLVIGTILENNQDRAKKGRSAKGHKCNRLTREEVAMIRLCLSFGSHSQYALARKYNCGESTIRDIKNWRTWRDVEIAPKPSKEYDPFADE